MKKFQSSIYDYIYWRGDLKITGCNITELDAVVLARLSYIPYENVAPESFYKKMTLREASIRSLAKEENVKNMVWKGDKELIEIAGKSERFGSLKICGYRNIIKDDKMLQFSAICFELDSEHHFISFRGTDNTIVGWQEDFNLFSTFPLPSQEIAVSYFEEAADSLSGSFYIGGHSKGGNLSVYSASFCRSELQDRIIHIYNFDGPGFDSKAIAESGYKHVKDRISTFVPQSSIVGMMFEHEESFTIIKSRQKGFLQHDIYTWETDRTKLVKLNEVTSMSVFVDHTLTDFIKNMTPEEQKAFTEAVFNILKETEEKTFTDLLSNWFVDTGRIFKSLSNLDPETRNMLSATLLNFIKCAKSNFKHINPIKTNNARSN